VSEEYSQHTVRVRPKGSKQWSEPKNWVHETKSSAEKVARECSRGGNVAEVRNDDFKVVSRFVNGRRW
jgi:hypothetical protein